MTKHLMALDVGEKRIGVALADTSVKISIPVETIEVDGSEVEQIAKLVLDESIDTLVVGYPRNQSGAPTKQTEYVENFATQLAEIGPKIVFQDESLTSVHAEELLKARKQAYSKGDIDALAASLILQDYLEARHG